MLIRIIKIFVLLLIVITIGCNNQSEWINTLPKPWLLNEDEINEILPEFHKKYPKFEDRLKAFVLWRVGTPYEIFKLGEETPPDTDPIIRLDVSDCTVHVLTSLAFAQSKTWNEARSKMIKIHYKSNEDGNHIPTYESRWHFTSDRILNNPYTVNITDKLIENDKLETVELVLNKKDDDSKLLEIDCSEKVNLSFIPNNHINSELLDKLPEICGIAFVKKSYFKNGLAIAHEGILIGNTDLIHASSIANKTVAVNFIDYYFNDREPLFDGIMIYKFLPIE